MASQQQPDPKLLRRLTPIKKIILVLSGKGGVGKSSVAAQLALSLSSSSSSGDPSGPSADGSSAPTPTTKVGLLDIDLTGPSIPRMLGLDGQGVKQSSDGWVPVYADPSQSLAVMSVGFLLKSKDDSVVWRGPKKNAMIRQFLGDVRWGPLDYLIIDTPPGTSDEHISILEYLLPFHPVAVMVTTPQAVSLTDNLRTLDFCRKTSLSLLGVIENMSGYICPHCGETINVWGMGGGEQLAKRERLRWLGRIPVDPGLVNVLDDAKQEVVAKLVEKKGVEEAQVDPRRPLPSSSVAATKELSALSLASDLKALGPPAGELGVTRPPSSTPAAPGLDTPAESAAPTGTLLSVTLLERYRASKTFPIFQAICARILAAAEGRDVEDAESLEGKPLGHPEPQKENGQSGTTAQAV